MSLKLFSNNSVFKISFKPLSQINILILYIADNFTNT